LRLGKGEEGGLIRARETVANQFGPEIRAGCFSRGMRAGGGTGRGGGGLRQRGGSLVVKNTEASLP